MLSDVFSKDEKYKIFSFTELEPIEVVGGKNVYVKNLRLTNLSGGHAQW
jgi:hypothetical protein